MAKTIVTFLSIMALAGAAQADDKCSFGGTDYSHGATVCQSGTQYRCDDGEWQSLAVQCKPDNAPPTCEYLGTPYSPGSTSCQSGSQYRCDGGTWTSLSIACPAPAAMPKAIDVPRGTRTCMIEGSTVGSASTVCKAGSTHLCDDGEWRNLGTPCQ